MSGRRLIAYVHVDGVPYGPDDEIPKKVAEQIGDHAWETVPAWEGEHGPETVQFTDPDDTKQREGGSPLNGVEAPPRSGRGSGIEAWREFAEQHDIEAPAGASRDDIIAACEAAELVEREE
ncbi:hypothetical protein EES45_22945 [Streptomyces sp. ADI97-07]|uniref:hypothetical protein n=1 Tax=Streptomyces sp. ADI97-07 TaxID=1522762 RepID=UPI000FB0AAAE|nr:hypothetical protein [Streptomyces sp. ADI97-07]RPK76620.1 hypothetical protein EES45_22945 [Streptomyces sp. ADI97-07]